MKTKTLNILTAVEAILAEIRISAGIRTLVFLVFHHKFQELIEKNRHAYQPDLIKYNVSQNKISSNNKKEKLFVELEDTRIDHLKLKEKTDGVSVIGRCIVAFGNLLVILSICSADGLLMIPVFLKMGLSLYEAIIGSLLTGILFLAYTFLAPFIVMLGRTRIQRILIATGLVILTVLFFYYMSIYRADYFALREVMEDGTIIILNSPSPWMFTTISVFMLMLSTGLDYFFSLTGDEWKILWQDIKNKRYFRANSRKLNRINKALEDVDAKTEIIRNESSSDFLEGRSNELLIISKAKQAYSEFLDVASRSKLLAGSTIEQSKYPYEFTRYFKFPEE